jgi:uncharacterized membrane protein HdeD (DUF308 family)
MAETIEVTTVTVDEGFFQRQAKLWWLFVVFGIAWSLFGIGLLSYRAIAIDTLALLFGLTFILAGVVELVMATQVTSWKWLWAAYGVLCVAAGIATIVWPDETLFVIAVFLAWFLVVSGIFNFVTALAGPKMDFWWLGLVLGLLQFVLGAWALRGGNAPPSDSAEFGREMLLLLNLAGIYALFKGFYDIFMGFAIHHAAKELEKA